MAKPLTLKINFSEKDLGAAKIRAEIEKLSKKPFVKVGVQGAKALENKDGSVANVVLVATAHEFGTVNVPERSYIRKTMNENESKYASAAEQLKSKILSAEINTEKALGVLGLLVQRDIQNTIRSNNAGLDGPTPLSPATLKNRKSKDVTPLYDTGQLIRSITYVRQMDGNVSTEGAVNL